MLLASLANGCSFALRLPSGTKHSQEEIQTGSGDGWIAGCDYERSRQEHDPDSQGTQKEKNDETNNSDRSLRRWLSCSSGLMAPPLARSELFVSSFFSFCVPCESGSC